MRWILAFIAGLLLLLLALWHGALPESTVRGLINHALADTGHSVEMSGFRKGLFCSFTVETLTLSETGDRVQGTGRSLDLHDVSAGLVPGSLLTLTPQLSLRARLAGGHLSAMMKLTGDPSTVVSTESVNLRDLSILRSYGIEGDGLVKANLNVSGTIGRVSFSVSDARLANTNLGGAPLPLSLFHTIRGIFDISREKAEIPSVALEGTGVYARIAGTIEGRLMTLKVEVMHDASYTPDPLVAAMLRPYRVSPGYYVIPVKQTAP